MSRLHRKKILSVDPFIKRETVVGGPHPKDHHTILIPNVEAVPGQRPFVVQHGSRGRLLPAGAADTAREIQIRWF